MKKKYDYAKITAHYQDCLDERSEWQAEWMQISDFLLPGRGVYDRLSKPRKRKLTTPRVINTMAEDSLYVLTSGMHGGLTSPSRPWFRLEWTDQNLLKMEPLVAWLEDCSERLHTALQTSNFYSIINSFYIEYAGFGTASMYIGHDTESDLIPFRFEIMTAGEYCFYLGPDGRMAGYFRQIFMSPRQLVERFGDKASESVRMKVENNESGIDRVDVTVLEYVFKERYKDFPITRIFYEETGSRVGDAGDAEKLPLEVDGFYEWPYPAARWGTIGSDVYGIGPGSRALPDIRRLQEMEKAFLMATHKAINPPLNIPARMKGKTNTLPGGKNYYANAQETINEIYQLRFDYAGVGSAVERVEQRIQRNFFNDIFLTAARDPNATPYKATEVNAREQEKMLRLGPVIERLQSEFLQPVIERCFNIMLRKGLFEPLSPDLAEMAGDFKISIISPLATAQRSVALQGINSFIGFLGNAAQFDQTILDNVNPDEAAREYADITGVKLGILRPEEEVAQIRQQRQQQMAQEKQRQDDLEAAQVGAQVQTAGADERKTSAEAGATLLESQQIASEMGMI